MEQNEIPALLISIDFEKCFDTIEFTALKGAMQFFNFGEEFIKMVFLLYRGFNTQIIHNGFLTTHIYPTRAIHQGCAISGYFFLLTAEILSMQIIKNKAIQGVKINGQEEMITQFVDDTHLLSLANQNSLENIISTFEEFRNNTGLKVNYQKSVIYPIGKSKNQQLNMKMSKSF